MKFKVKHESFVYTHKGYDIKLNRTNCNVYQVEILNNNNQVVKEFYNIRSKDEGLSQAGEFINNELVNPHDHTDELYSNNLSRQEKVNKATIKILENAIKDIREGDCVENIDISLSPAGNWLELYFREDADCNNLNYSMLKDCNINY